MVAKPAASPRHEHIHLQGVSAAADRSCHPQAAAGVMAAWLGLYIGDLTNKYDFSNNSECFKQRTCWFKKRNDGILVDLATANADIYLVGKLMNVLFRYFDMGKQRVI
jgi:hypothetical protein